MSHEFSEISQQLETWYARDAGERLFAEIRERSRPILEVAFGYHIFQKTASRQGPQLQNVIA
ncbi:MAG: hypothetical protein RIC38_13220, partial [Chromatocurvus sp.]